MSDCSCRRSPREHRRDWLRKKCRVLDRVRQISRLRQRSRLTAESGRNSGICLQADSPLRSFVQRKVFTTPPQTKRTMLELRGIVPRPARVAKQGRCAEGPCVKTMLSADALEFGLPRFMRAFPSPRVFASGIRKPVIDN